MLTSLSSAVTGLDSFQEDMDVIGNDIANVDTTGYKAANVDFADAFSQTLRAPGAATSTTSGSASVQIGTGVGISAINNNWNQGALNNTGITSDLAISGNGFFMVRDTLSNAQYATRDGTFTVDANGYLITDTGERVQGYTDAGLTTLGDIKIDTTGMPATSSPTAVVQSYGIDVTGKVTVNLSDGTSFVRGQILLQNFQDPNELIKEGDNLYSNTAAAGPLAALSAPGSTGLGSVQSGALESSNVDLAGEMSNLIIAQRGFEANSKVITTSDEVLQTLVNMKR
ncbi:MAG TPA: flagellar hook-basal body complex protein [Verrucomicrobiae bacterium]|jgi:flagellar hook protein FlgE|nr:flagellar hook-basal body complex protein [Verrucomicrobiae bacterium]